MTPDDERVAKVAILLEDGAQVFEEGGRAIRRLLVALHAGDPAGVTRENAALEGISETMYACFERMMAARMGAVLREAMAGAQVTPRAQA